MFEFINSNFRKLLGSRRHYRNGYKDKTNPLPANLLRGIPQIGDNQNAPLVPYDEGLFKRACTQWEIGDWIGLASLDRDTLQHHPDRAKLALLAATGKMHSNDSENAKHLIRLAEEWGCSKDTIAQVLVAGVHNSLGRATSAIGQPDRAMKHFSSAVTYSGQGVDVRELGRARAEEQLRQLGNDESASLRSTKSSSKAAAIETVTNAYIGEIRALSASLKQQHANIELQLANQTDELNQHRKAIELLIKHEINNSTKQIQTFIGLRDYFESTELPLVNPERHSWPISPDFGLYLIALLEARNYDLIIEFGSGISTVLISKFIASRAERKSSSRSIEFISFEHLAKYYEESTALVEQAKVARYVNLFHAPLKDYIIKDRVFPYYDCQEKLDELAQRHVLDGLHILVLVDGPPGATAKNARYPAAPLILKHFAGATIDLLLDDYIRDDEKEVVRMWQSDIVATGLQHKKTESKLEKDACLITIEPPREALV